MENSSALRLKERRAEADESVLIRRTHGLAGGVHGQNRNADVSSRHGQQGRGHRAYRAAAGQVGSVHVNLQGDLVRVAKTLYDRASLRIGRHIRGRMLSRTKRKAAKE